MGRNDEPEVDSGERGYTRHLTRLAARAEVMVGAGAIVGVLGRYAVGRWTSQHLLWTFPVGTFAVNIALRNLSNSVFPGSDIPIKR